MRNMPLLCLALLLLTSCPGSDRKYKTGHFQDNIINFTEVNSIYDDYNMDAPFIYNHWLFHFSSNRNSKGGDFDIIGANMYINWEMKDGTLTIGTDLDEDWYAYLIPLFDSVNTSCNELGPYTLDYINFGDSETHRNDLMLYASDCDGNFDIRFVGCEKIDSTGSEITLIQSPRKIDFINTGFNELYPSFYGQGFYNFDIWGVDPAKIEKMLFCSDRNGNFDIFEVDLPENTDIKKILNGEFTVEPGSLAINPLALNSANDDKCPFVNGNLLVFASNREGGYGGFDLYYSVNEDGTWTSPVNFGEGINTSYDEYRPVTIHHDDFDNNLLMFSSNRPGGKGGFDLYHVGIKQMIRQE